MQTDVCIRIINEKMNIKFLVRWVFDVPAIIAFGFSSVLKLILDSRGLLASKGHGSEKKEVNP